MKKLNKNNENYFNAVKAHRNIRCTSLGQSTCDFSTPIKYHGKEIAATEGNMVMYQYEL